MANYATLKAAIIAAIKENGNHEITGNLLQQQLLAMVNSLGAGYQYMGIATPETNPGTPDQKVFYIAKKPGEYTNFGSVTVNGCDILKWDTGWTVEQTGFASRTEIQKFVYYVDKLASKILNNLTISTLHNYVYDDGTGVGFEASGYQSSEKVAYIPDGVLGRSFTEAFFYDENDNYLGHSASLVSPYANTARVAFYYGLGINVADSILYVSQSNLEAVLEQAINDINKKVFFLVPTANANKTYDDSTGYLIDYPGRSATDKMPYISDGISDGILFSQVLFWDKNFKYLGYGSTLVSPYPNTEYIAFNLTAITDAPRYYSPNCLENRIQELGSSVGDLETDSETNLKRIGLAGGTIAPIENKTATIPLVTSSFAGLMSAQDKAKLDNIVNPGSITIEGSGVTKNASAYGFLPTKTAVENAQALKNCLVGGGRILIDYPGVYDLCDSMVIPSDTELIFGAGVYIRKQKNANNVAATYPFINEGAFTRTYDNNITIRGLHLITNGIDVDNLGSGDVPRIPGLRGQLSFFYIKNLELDGIYILDGVTQNYNVHICTFENIYLHDMHIEGLKDALHFGRGNNFTIRHCFLKTLDDGLAFNAYDYVTSSPEVGWITNGLVEDIHFLPAPESYGLARNILLMAGAWKDWASGMSFHSQGDCVVSNGRIYRTNGALVSGDFVSTYQPTHTSGQQTYPDGITWLYIQDTDIGYTAGCKRIHFKDLFYDRISDDCANFWFENSLYVRTYYPGAQTPVQEDITFEGIRMPGNILNTIVQCITPVQNVKIINCECNAANILKIPIREIDPNSGIDYGEPSFLLMGNTYNQGGGQAVARIDEGRSCKLRIVGSLLIGGGFLTTAGTGESDIEILSSDVQVH